MAATTDTEREGRWVVKASQASRDAINPVRGFEENLFKDVLKERRTDIEFIKLSIGDTAALPVHPAVPEAVKKVLESGGCTGYGHSRGLPETRAALARLYSPFTLDPRGLTAEDVIMANACSGALEMCVTVLTEPGQNVLVPSPGFGLYSCLAGSRGIKCHFYKLQADRGWEVDLADLERQIDSETAALIVNNPSNPCGSSYSQQHLLDILAIAERHRLPIIADEIYAWMTFPGSEFHMLSSLSRTVPILSCSSLSKRYMVAGWRMGWVIVHDRQNAFRDEVIPGLARLATKVLGPSTLVQAAIPDIISKVPEDYHQKNLSLFHRNALHIMESLGPTPGLFPVMPRAAMYHMNVTEHGVSPIFINQVVIEMKHFPEFQSDVEFAKALVTEQNVFCLPSPAFNTKDCFRIVLGCEESKIQEACHRIAAFAKLHYKQ